MVWVVLMACAAGAAILALTCALATRVSGRLAFAGGVAIVMLVIADGVAFSRAQGLPIVVVIASLLVALTVAGGAVAYARRKRLVVSREALTPAVAACAGALVWIAAVVASQFVPGASRLGWVLNGDGFNNITVAHTLLDGTASVTLTKTPEGSLAAIASPLGHLAVDGPVSTVEDSVLALVVVWTLMQALWCVVAGAVVSSALPAAVPRVVVAIAAALGSFVPLAAGTGGMAMDWGYFNVAVAVPGVLLGWLCLREGVRHPVASITVLTLSAGFALRSWEPLVMIPAVAALSLLIAGRRRLLTVRGWRLVVPLVAAAYLVATYLISVAPRSATVGSVLSFPQLGFAGVWPIVIAIAAITIACAVLGRRLLPASVPRSAVVWVAACGASALGVYVLVRGDADAWSGYYPSKLSLMLLAVAAPVALAVLTGVVAGSLERRGTRLAAMGVALAGVAGLVGVTIAVPAGAPGFAQRTALERTPVVKVLAGSTWAEGERSVDRFLALTEPDAPGLLWHSGDADEGVVNFWVALSSGADYRVADLGLRRTVFEAYRETRATAGYAGMRPDQVCAAGDELPGLTIYTLDVETARTSLAEECGADAPAVAPVSVLDELVAGRR